MLPLLSLSDLDEIQTRCLQPKLIRNPTLHTLVDLIHNINSDTEHPICPSTLERPINVAEFPVIITGSVENPMTHLLEHAGWLVQILGSIHNTPFKGAHILKLLANLNPCHPSPIPIQIPIMVSSLSSFRRYGCKIVDHLSFDRAAFLYIPQTHDILRLWTMRCLIDLPQVPSIGMCLHHFIPAAPTYAISSLSQLQSPKKRPRVPAKGSLKYSLERSLLTCLNSYFRQSGNLEEALHLLINDSMDTFDTLLVLQQSSDQSGRLDRLQHIWRTTQEQYYPSATQTLPHEDIYFIEEQDLI